MGRIYFIMGKSACGKDTVYDRLTRDPNLDMQRVIPVTTRPKREFEVDGREYHFISEEELEEYHRKERIIESRSYETCYGRWTYATLDDGQFDLDTEDYLMVGVIESFLATKRYFGEHLVKPIYLEADDGERLMRSLALEQQQKEPHYDEVCRRFLSDQRDFSEENLRRAGIETRFENDILGNCIVRIRKYIEAERLKDQIW